MRNKGKRKEYIYRNRVANKKGRLRAESRHKNHSFYGKTKEQSDVDFLPVGYSHKVLKHLKQEKFELRGFKGLGQTVVINLPKIFSISENPENTIKLLRKLYTVGKNPMVRKICFKYDECEQMGLSASTIMDIIVLALEQMRVENGWDLELEGNYPKNSDVRTILCASGLPYHLKIKPTWLLDETNIKRFHTVSGEGKGYSCKSSVTATKLTRYFDECLSTQGLELNGEGKRLLSGIMGEVLDNCESHGGSDATWYTQGHYQVGKGNEYGEMQLLFLSLGSSIYEGLKDEASRETQRRLAYLKQQMKYRLSSEFDEEVLYTMLSLQEGISRLRDREKEGYGGRGSGTVRMIQFFEDFGETEAKNVEPRLSILSGNAFISFDKKYKMQPAGFYKDEAFGTGERQIIAFNEQNDIYQHPDVTYVRKIGERFPGTIISLKFYLDGRYIRRQSGLGE